MDGEEEKVVGGEGGSRKGVVHLRKQKGPA